MTQTAELSTPGTTVASARILVVDDEVCIADLLSEMLRILGFTPTACNSPLAALELLAREDFDVVLSDFRMPHLNGDEFFRRVPLREVAVAAVHAELLVGEVLLERSSHFQRRDSLSRRVQIGSSLQ